MYRVVQWRPVVVALIALCTLFPVAAFSLELPMLTWQGHEVTSLAATKTLPNTMLTFRLSPDFTSCFENTETCGLVFRSDDLPIDGMRLQVRDCQEQQQEITCEIGPFTFATQDENIEFEYFAQIGSERIDWQTGHIAILIDNTQPTLTSITTDYCDDTCCYVAGGAPTDITLRIEDSQTRFDFGLLFVGTETSTAQVEDCSLPECRATITLACADGDRVMIGPQSVGGISAREDAQNELLGEPQSLCCSTAAPIVNSCESEANGVAGLAVRDGTIIYTMDVQSFAGAPRGEVNVTAISNTTELVELTCELTSHTENTYTCTWVIDDLQPGTATLEFRVFDAIGNTVTVEKDLTVLDLQEPPAGEAVDLFDGNIVEVLPERLNRMAVDVAIANHQSYPLYVTYDFTRKQDNVQIMAQELTSCEYRRVGETAYSVDLNLFALGKGNGNERASRVLHPSADWDVVNRLNLEVDAQRETLRLSDIFEARCTVDLIVRDDTAVYTEPEQEVFEFTVGFRESALGDPGQAFVERIETLQQELNGSTAERVRKLEKWRQQADKICQGVEKIVYIHNTAVALQGLGDAYCSTGFGAAIGKAIGGIGSVIFTFTDGFLEGAWNGMYPGGGRLAHTINKVKKATEINAHLGIIPQNNALLESGGWLKKICRQVNCRVTADMQSSGSKRSQRNDARRSQGGQGEAGGSRSQPVGVNLGADPTGPGSWEGSRERVGLVEYAKEEVLALSNVADPEASLSGALFSMCLGGVIYNMQKQQALDCNYLQCLKEQAYYGHSISICDKSKQYQMCLYTVGEAMELPFARTIKNVMGNMNSIIAALPAFLAKHFLNEGCANYYGGLGAKERVACPDWVKVGCLVGNSALNTIDSQRNAQHALGGIPHEKAEQALALCEQSLLDEPQEPRIASRPNTLDIERQQVLRQLNRKSTQSDQSRFVNELNTAWDMANVETGARRPDSWNVQRRSDGAIHTITPQWRGKAPVYVAPRIETDPGIPDAKVRKQDQSIVFDVPKGQGTNFFKRLGSLGGTLPDVPQLPSLDKYTQYLPQRQTVDSQIQETRDRLDAQRALLTEKTPKEKKDKTTRAVRIPLLVEAPKDFNDAPDPFVAWLADDVSMAHPEAANMHEAQQRYIYSSFYTAVEAAAPNAESLTALVQQYEAEYDAILHDIDAIQDQKEDVVRRRWEIEEEIAVLHQKYEELVREEHERAALEHQEFTLNIQHEGEKVAEEDLYAQYKALLDEKDAFKGTSVQEFIAATRNYDTLLTDMKNLEQHIDACTGDSCAQLQNDLKKQQQKLNTYVNSPSFGTPALQSYAQIRTAYNEYKQLQEKTAAATCDTTCTARIAQYEAAYPAFTQDDVPLTRIALQVTIDKNTERKKTLEAADKFGEAIVVIADYGVKHLLDEGKLDFLTLSGWAEEVPAFGEALDWSNTYLNPEEFKQTLCNDKEFDIRDNDLGAIYQPSGFGVINHVATFAAEFRRLNDWEEETFFYLTVVYVANPQGSGQEYEMEIILKDLQECVGECPAEVSLTNGATFLLAEGASFSNGEFARTRLDYLSGLYGQLCLRFNTSFPDAKGATEHCRAINEDTINTGSPVPPEEERTAVPREPDSTPGADPTGGWT